MPTRLPFPDCGIAFALGMRLACLAAALLSAGVARGAPPDEKAELAALLDDARHYVIRTAKTGAELKLQEPPVLNFTNPERNQERGSVFVCLDEGRPAVIGQLFRFNVRDRRPTKHAMHSLMPVPLEARFRDKLAWTPQQPGIEWHTIPEAPVVGTSRAQRLLQMRRLVRPFRVSLIDPRDKPTELRLAPQPLFEYSAPWAGVMDGAIFSYFVATDPEAVLLVEAFDEGGKSGFRYVFARLHFWRLTATVGDRTVWDVEHVPRPEHERQYVCQPANNQESIQQQSPVKAVWESTSCTRGWMHQRQGAVVPLRTADQRPKG